MELPGLFFQRLARSSGCSAVLTINNIRQVEGKIILKFRSSKGAEFVATFSGTSPAESTAGQSCDLCVSKWRRRPFFKKKSKAYSGRFYQGDIFRRPELKARGAGEPKRAAQPWAARSQRLRSASRSAPLGDTTSLVGQAQKTAQGLRFHGEE